MGDPFHGNAVPRGALLGAAALVALTLVLAATARVSGVGLTRMPEADPVVVRELRFGDRADGAVVISDWRTREVITVLPPGTNGFTRGVMRGMARERRSMDIDSAPPFRLTRWSDGRLSLEDPSTGRRIELDAFGPTNTAAFANLLGAPPPAP